MASDWRITPETFDVDGSGYALIPIDDPTLQIGIGAWSPDGDRIVAGGWDDTDPSRAGLYTFGSVDGDGLFQLTGPGGRPDFGNLYSPDGSRILIARAVKPYDHSGPMDLLVVRENGEDLVGLNPPGTTGGSMGYITSWSPDGRQVAFVAAKGSFWEDPRAVFVADAHGTDVRRITPWNATYGVKWSPDGAWIVFDFVEIEPLPPDVFIMHPDGSGAQADRLVR